MDYIDQFKTPCPKCSGEDWEIKNQVNRGGHKRHPLSCKSCGYISSVCVPVMVVERYFGKDLIYESPPDDAKACEVCGKIGSELHHWAPRFIFDQEAEQWPKSYLCQKCHNRWHIKVTPRMTKGLIQ